MVWRAGRLELDVSNGPHPNPKSGQVGAGGLGKHLTATSTASLYLLHAQCNEYTSKGIGCQSTQARRGAVTAPLPRLLPLVCARQRQFAVQDARTHVVHAGQALIEHALHVGPDAESELSAKSGAPARWLPAASGESSYSCQMPPAKPSLPPGAGFQPCRCAPRAHQCHRARSGRRQPSYGRWGAASPGRE